MYSIDTSALIDGWVRFYPPEVFPALWERIEDLIVRELLVASQSVFHEIEAGDDSLTEWVKTHKEMFIEDCEDVQSKVRRIQDDWPNPVDFTRKLTGADLFVIGLAQVRGFAVVTGEKPTNNLSAPKIPDACLHGGTRCLNLLQMIQEQGWRFSGR